MQSLVKLNANLVARHAPIETEKRRVRRRRPPRITRSNNKRKQHQHPEDIIPRVLDIFNGTDRISKGRGSEAQITFWFAVIEFSLATVNFLAATFDALRLIETLKKNFLFFI